jgi:hypothetical protein
MFERIRRCSRGRNRRSCLCGRGEWNDINIVWYRRRGGFRLGLGASLFQFHLNLRQRYSHKQAKLEGCVDLHHVLWLASRDMSERESTGRARLARQGTTSHWQRRSTMSRCQGKGHCLGA